jgi:CRP-like cAMP-binding protein
MTDDYNRFFKKGEYLCLQNEPGDKMFVIRTGRVLIQKKLFNGKVIDIAVLRSGDFLGEMSLIDPAPRSASAVALEPVKAVEIGMSNLESVILKQPQLTLKLMKMFCSRIRETNRLHENYVSQFEAANLNLARLLIIIVAYDYKFENIISNKITVNVSYDELKTISGLKDWELDSLFDDLKITSTINNQIDKLLNLDAGTKIKLNDFLSKIMLSVTSTDFFCDDVWKNRIRNEPNPHQKDKLYQKYKYLKDVHEVNKK